MVTDKSSEPRNRLPQPNDLDLNEFFDLGTEEAVVRNDDLEAIVPNSHKNDLLEQKRYWVNPPFVYAVIFRSKRDEEHQYYLVEPHLNNSEAKLVKFLKDKIRQSIDYNSIQSGAERGERAKLIRNKTYELMDNYNLLSNELAGKTENLDPISEFLNKFADKVYSYADQTDPTINSQEINDDIVEQLDRRDAEKIIYYIIRDYIGFERIDGLMRDVYVEDISQSGWGEPTFIVHSEYGHMITNVSFGEENLDQFVTNIAQKADKGISKRQPDVDARLEDGSRVFMSLGDEITPDGTVFDIRQFNQIPFTPIDLINWGTYSIDMIVYLWLVVEAGKSAIVAGGTASGKTTTLNAISMFIPATKKVVSIEDTREIQIPQRNWKSTVTRESFGDGAKGDIKEYRLLKNSLRMNPDYVIFGEVRDEAARSLFQNMNTGHATYSTFHGEGSEEVRVRLTTDPINVDETTFSGLDLVITQEEVSIAGQTERRCSSITEIGDYNPKSEKFSIEEPFVWNTSTDGFEGSLTTEHMKNTPQIIDDIRHENGWNDGELEEEINRRRIVLAYLIDNEMKSYTDVAAVIQGYMNNKENVLSKIGSGNLERDVDQLKRMKNIDISINPEKEEQIPRPDASSSIKQQARAILNNNQHLYEDVDREVDMGDFQTTQETRLMGDSYESRSRVIEPEEDEGGSEDDTPYGYEGASDTTAEHQDTDDDDGIFEGIGDPIKDSEEQSDETTPTDEGSSGYDDTESSSEDVDQSSSSDTSGDIETEPNTPDSPNEEKKTDDIDNGGGKDNRDTPTESEAADGSEEDIDGVDDILPDDSPLLDDSEEPVSDDSDTQTTVGSGSDDETHPPNDSESDDSTEDTPPQSDLKSDGEESSDDRGDGE